MKENSLNVVLMLLALAAACLLPFELLILAYAFLGPAHYLTEISWLRQKRFFMNHRAGLLALLLLALGYILLFSISPWLSGLTVLAALCLAALLATPDLSGKLLMGCWLAATLTLTLNIQSATIIALFAILVPTLVHVCLFTFVFMIGGAQRSRRLIDWLPPAIYLICIGMTAVLPLTTSQSLFGMDMLSEEYFGNVSLSLGHMLGTKVDFASRFCALLGFVYAYHYLNWFVKVRTIRWNRIPRLQMLIIVLTSVAAGALYLYDYALGFAVLATLSILHVFLEFPLNAISIANLRRAPSSV